MTEEQYELADEIRDTPISDSNFEAFQRVISRLDSTTQALTALAMILSESGDTEGSALLLDFADGFADHEAKTL